MLLSQILAWLVDALVDSAVSSTLRSTQLSPRCSGRRSCLVAALVDVAVSSPLRSTQLSRQRSAQARLADLTRSCVGGLLHGPFGPVFVLRVPGPAWPRGLWFSCPSRLPAAGSWAPWPRGRAPGLRASSAPGPWGYPARAWSVGSWAPWPRVRPPGPRARLAPGPWGFHARVPRPRAPGPLGPVSGPRAPGPVWPRGPGVSCLRRAPAAGSWSPRPSVRPGPRASLSRPRGVPRGIIPVWPFVHGLLGPLAQCPRPGPPGQLGPGALSYLAGDWRCY